VRVIFSSFSLCFALKTTTKKVVDFFGVEKCTTEKILPTPMSQKGGLNA